MSRWRFWIDRGGTFTDVVAQSAGGQLIVRKVPSQDPNRTEDAALRGIRAAMGLEASAPLPADLIEQVRMGTTVATNALLERKGTPTVFVTTRGFQDLLQIGDQHRPDIFALEIRRPEVLYDEVIEVSARHSADGEELEPLDLKVVRRELEAAYAKGCRSCAIALIHAYQFPAHEQAVAEVAREVGFGHVSASHAVAPLVRLVPRAETTVVDAYVAPSLRKYIGKLSEDLHSTSLQFMQSNGGLADADRFRGKDALLSGPAGGVVGAAAVSRAAGFDKLISFDMGGTSTDVAHYAGDFERSYESELAGMHLRVPMLSIHTIAAGGGSVVRFDGMRYRVGPDSAGADPGPIAYGRGGPPTITDCNVMVGKLQQDFFPSLFGPAGNDPLDVDAVHEAFARMAAEIGDGRSAEAVAAAFLNIAVDKMARAIEKISLRKGHDISDHVLCCFGGAGGQHACLLAEALGMKHVLVHPLAGVLSAYGIGQADVHALRERSVEMSLTPDRLGELENAFEDLAREARAEVESARGTFEALEIQHRLRLRYEGTDVPLPVDFAPDISDLRERFEAAHRQRYGFVRENHPLVVDAAAAEAIRRSTAPETSFLREDGTPEDVIPKQSVEVYTRGRWHEAPVFRRQHLPIGEPVDGPLLIRELTSTTMVEPGWQVTLTERGDLVLKHTGDRPRRVGVAVGARAQDNPEAVPSEPDPVMLEVMANRFRSIAEHMGETLRLTSHSVNIKERLDFSCALFDAEGRLIANAPHIPVHLGSMGASVRSILASHGSTMKPGDVVVQNNPYDGGTHLPDITVVTPVFEDSNLLFFVGSRGHHADIGGITPGSMPPHSTTIQEEGVLIENMRLVEGGRFREEAFRNVLTSGSYPARNPEQNIADIQAQIAANQHGVRLMQGLLEEYGRPFVVAYMQHVIDNAAEHVRRVIDRLGDGAFTVRLDSGEPIRVSVSVDRDARRARIDFTGTAPQVGSNFNAPEAVCHAVVLYVFRTLVEEDIPLNEGCLEPLDIVIPEGSLLSPHYPAAVVAGNVETSQLVADALYGALGRLAGSQGTMNNVTFGNARHQYYETICGGAGAGPDFDGTSAVHTHMTNSRLTDPEILEIRYPVRVEHFGIRRGSGGDGQYRGGDGAVRRIRFLEPMTVSILSSRRREVPFGLEGGNDGSPGRNLVERLVGIVEALEGTASFEAAAGEVLVVATPGGGGFGTMQKELRGDFR